MDLSNDALIYTLGFIWADGYIIYHKNKRLLKKSKEEKIYSYPETVIEIVKDDMDILFDSAFNKTNIEWKKIENRQRKNWKIQSKLRSTNTVFFNFLLENEYKEKSNLEPLKILSLIPENKKYLWWRGYSDGDGCFYISEKWSITQYMISSPFVNSNKSFIDLLESLGIKKYESKKRTSKKGHQFSSVRLHNRKDCYNWGKYIYQNIENDNIGLPRKYDKFVKIKEMLGEK